MAGKKSGKNWLKYNCPGLLLYFDELSIFEYSKAEFSFQSVAVSCTAGVGYSEVCTPSCPVTAEWKHVLQASAVLNCACLTALGPASACLAGTSLTAGTA